MKYLIAGAKGQLGTEFQRELAARGETIAAPAEDAFDITDPASVREAVRTCRPDIVLNCAAYNFVDQAETDRDRAFSVNADGPANLAAVCLEQGLPFVHYSTDYVFDGSKEGLYLEGDLPNPLNQYGASKLEGERRVMEIGGRSLIFRTSWVFGRGPQNFLFKLLEWARQKPVLRIVTDQVSIPTYTEDLVNYTLLALGQGMKGLYHLTNSDYATRYEVARHFLGRMGMDTVVLPVTGETFPTPARRPYFTAMSNRRLQTELHTGIPHWKDAVDRYVASIRSDK